MAETHEVEIERLGAEGDGVVTTHSGPLFVPFALPGERWRLDGTRGTLLGPSSDERQAAPCRHFMQCGGCVAQHMRRDLYVRWKTGIVADAFARRGLAPDIAPLVEIGAGTRRRAVLGAKRQGRDVVLGFREEGRHTLVDLVECPILAPEIVAAFPALRRLAALLLRDADSLRIAVTRLDHGLDVSMDGGRGFVGADLAAQLAAEAEAARLVRLIVDGDPISTRGLPTLTLGNVAIELPAGSFLQAVPEAERIMTELIAATLPKKPRRIADLFSGLGTFTYVLARHAPVLAVDGDKRAIEALAHAAKRVAGVKPIEARVRDLFREPLSRKELEPFDVVVFDPPRAGASGQAAMLAKSKVPVVVAVSCNPATLARDVRTLVDGGYALGRVTPVDQFVFSPHVEAVAVLTR